MRIRCKNNPKHDSFSVLLHALIPCTVTGKGELYEVHGHDASLEGDPKPDMTYTCDRCDEVAEVIDE